MRRTTSISESLYSLLRTYSLLLSTVRRTRVRQLMTTIARTTISATTSLSIESITVNLSQTPITTTRLLELEVMANSLSRCTSERSTKTRNDETTTTMAITKARLSISSSPPSLSSSKRRSLRTINQLASTTQQGMMRSTVGLPRDSTAPRVPRSSTLMRSRPMPANFMPTPQST